MKEKAFIFLPILAAIWFVSTSCGHPPSATTRAATLSQQSQPLHEVEVTRVLSQKLSASVRLPAQLSPYEVVDIYPKVTGFVKQIEVDRGSKVKSGELIAQLDAPELVAQRAEADSKYQSAESQILAAQAKLASDEATYKRMSAASKVPGVIAGNDLNVAEKTVQADQANVAALQKNVQAAQGALRAVAQLENYLNIVAPFDGQVTARYIHPGALVGPAGGPGGSSPMLRIETLTRLRLVVPVPEYDAAGVPEGTQVSFSVPSFPGRTFRAPIARISHAVDVKTRTMPVELDVRDPRGELVPGSFCEVEWPVRRNYPTLFVPASAVASDLARTFVVRVQNNRAEWVDVKTGASVGKLIEVFGDLHAGDEVVLSGTDQIEPGAPITPQFVGTEKH
jgi:membrane fusion protein, multidrug efflux system